MKKCLLVFISIIFGSILFALPNNFRLSVEPVYNLQNGTIVEYVFVNDAKSNNTVKLSELDWSVSNISYLGSRVNFGWKLLEVDTDFAVGIPEKSGSLIDLDWQDFSVSGNKYYYNDSSMCTNWSRTDNKLTQAFDFNIHAGARFNPVSSLYITPTLGYSYSYKNFYTANGTYKYGTKKNTGFAFNLPYDDPRVVEQVLDERSAISYERECHNVTLQVDAHYLLADRVTFGLLVAASPFTYVSSIDHHFSRDGSNPPEPSYFLDIMQGAFKQWKFGTYIECKIWKGLSLSTSFDYELLLLIQGENYENTERKFYRNSKTSIISGTENNLWNFKFSAKWDF